MKIKNGIMGNSYGNNLRIRFPIYLFEWLITFVSIMEDQITQGKLSEKYSSFSDHWNPRVIAELNGQAVKIAKVQGEFPWHAHENEDEMFYVVKGTLEIELRTGTVVLNEGEYAVIPKGVEHSPRAREETQILMFEPIATLNTGNIKNEFTREDLEKI